MSQNKMRTHSVKFNFIMNFLLSASSFVFPLITFPYVSRVLQSEGTGSVAFATSVITYFSMFASLGISSYGIRACAKVRHDKTRLSRTAHELIFINAVTTALVYVAFFISLLIVPKFFAQKTLLVICSLSIVLNTVGVSWLYQSLEMYSFITICNLMCKVISLVGMFLFVKSAGDTVPYAFLTVLSAAGSNLFNFFGIGRHILLKPVGNYNIRQHLKPILVFFATSVAISIYTNLDIVMLGFLKTDSEVGLYNASIKIKNVLTALLTSLGGVLLPRLSVFIKSGEKQKFNNLLTKVFDFVFITAIPLTVFFIFFAKDTVLVLSGADYLGAVPSMTILMPTVFLIALSNTTGIQTLVPLGKESAVMKSVFCGAAVDFILNLVLIPRFESAGAAISTLVAEAVVLVIQCLFLKDIIIKIISPRKLIIPFIISFVCLVPTAFISINNTFFRLAVCGIIYFACYFLILLLKKSRTK